MRFPCQVSSFFSRHLVECLYICLCHVLIERPIKYFRTLVWLTETTSDFHVPFYLNSIQPRPHPLFTLQILILFPLLDSTIFSRSFEIIARPPSAYSFERDVIIPSCMTSFGLCSGRGRHKMATATTVAGGRTRGGREAH